MKTAYLNVLLGCLFNNIFCGIASACDCLPRSPAKEALVWRDAIFLGTITGINKEGYGRELRVKVRAAWKGVATDSTVFVAVGSATDNCAPRVWDNADFLFYCLGKENHFSSNRCLGIVPVSQAAMEIEALDAAAKLNQFRAVILLLLLICALQLGLFIRLYSRREK